MKYTSFLIIAPLLLGACDTNQSVMQPEFEPAFAANKTTTEFDTPFVFEGPNPCVEDGTEIIFLSGTTHTTITEKFKDKGAVDIVTRTEAVDVSGRGTTGATYTATGGSSDTFSLDPNSAFSVTFTNTFKVKSNDGGTDFTVVETFRLSINKEG